MKEESKKLLISGKAKKLYHPTVYRIIVKHITLITFYIIIYIRLLLLRIIYPFRYFRKAFYIIMEYQGSRHKKIIK